MGDAEQVAREAFVQVMLEELACLSEDERSILLTRQVSEWGELASIAELEERFDRPMASIVAIEAQARDRLHASGARWWRSLA